ncbi:MAG: dipeptidase [Parvularculaceae bacterium]|nr:dipeptidase [Parvularculaceae bacterium]
MRTVIVTLPFLLSSALAAPLSDPALEAKARAIHDRVIALDTHVDIPDDFATAGTDPGGFTKSQVDLPKMRAGGLDAAFFIVYTPHGPLTPEDFKKGHDIAFSKLAAIHRFASAYPAQVTLAQSAADARKIARSGRKIAFIGMENAYPLGPSPSQADIDGLAAAGIRYAGITHFGHNQFGDSSNPDVEAGDPEEKWGGLSPVGRDLVAMLNRAGIMVDVSHAGRKTMMQAVELSKAPIIASHSGVKAIADSPRNLDDEQLRALAANGGVAQIVALDVYVKPYNDAQKAFQENLRKEMGLDTAEKRAAASAELQADYEKRMEGVWDIEPRASVVDFVNHIDHAVKVAGIDHVGIASDFDGGGGIVGWEDASETLNVTRELVKRGYSEEDIAKIWSGNLLRVLADVEKTAAALKKEAK